MTKVLYKKLLMHADKLFEQSGAVVRELSRPDKLRYAVHARN